MNRYLLAIFTSLTLSACSLAPEFQQPQMAIPEGWSKCSRRRYHQRSRTRPAYWQELGSEELNRVVNMALAQNLDLEAALHRIEQARAQAKIAGSALYPSDRCERWRIAELSGFGEQHGGARSRQVSAMKSIYGARTAINWQRPITGRKRLEYRSRCFAAHRGRRCRHLLYTGAQPERAHSHRPR